MADDDADLAVAIGEWVLATARERPGARICTGFMIDDHEVNVGIVGFAHGGLEPELARARRKGKPNRTWRRVFPGRGGQPQRGVL